MSELPSVGTVFEEPGFHAEVVGMVSGLLIFEVRLDGAVPAHAAQADEFAIVTQGAISVTINYAVFTRHTGEWLFIPAGTVHEVKVVGPARLLMIG